MYGVIEVEKVPLVGGDKKRMGLVHKDERVLCIRIGRCGEMWGNSDSSGDLSSV